MRGSAKCESKGRFHAAVAEGHVRFPHHIGNYVAGGNCVNAASERFSPTNDTAAPLIRATRLSLAVKVDRGEITPEDAAAELQCVAFEARQEQARTAVAVAAGQGARMMGAAAAARAIAPVPQVPFSPMSVPQPTRLQTTCDTIGTITSCN